MRTPVRKIAWVESIPRWTRAYQEIIHEDPRVEIANFSYAGELLNACRTNFDYRLIVTEDRLAPGPIHEFHAKDGIGVAAEMIVQIRKTPDYRNTLILVVTTGLNEFDRVQFNTAGATRIMDLAAHTYIKEFRNYILANLDLPYDILPPRQTNR